MLLDLPEDLPLDLLELLLLDLPEDLPLDLPELLPLDLPEDLPLDLPDLPQSPLTQLQVGPHFALSA